MGCMVETQAFLQFTLTRLLDQPENLFETMFIDQSILEVTRKIGFKTSEFLNDPAYNIISTYFCIGANKNEDETIISLKTSWPVNFDENSFREPRTILPFMIENTPEKAIRVEATLINRRLSVIVI